MRTFSQFHHCFIQRSSLEIFAIQLCYSSLIFGIEYFIQKITSGTSRKSEENQKYVYILYHSGPENLKKSRPKKLMKSNKSISRFFFGPNFIFCNVKNGQKSIFELGKSLKLPEMQFHEKKLIYLISRVFLPGLF